MTDSAPITDGETAPSALDTLRLEPSEPTDTVYDYCLQPYEPLPQSSSALRSVNLLMASFALAEVEHRGRLVVEALRQALGLHQTVWGIKQQPGGEVRSWEFYFYNWSTTEPRTGITPDAVCAALDPLFPVRFELRPGLPWHMFSVELDVDVLRGGHAADIEVYVGSRNYIVRGDALEMKNLYTFHRPLEDVADMLERLDLSPQFDRALMHSGTLLPFELTQCYRICVANKRHADALYFQRADTGQLLYFMRAHGWPAELVRFVEQLQPRLGHLLWDLGVDFVRASNGVQFVKSGVYGIL